MHTVLALQITVRHVAFDIERHGLDTRLVAFLQVLDGHRITVFLAVTLVHTHQLFRPVLSLRTTGTTHDLQHRRHLVFLVTQHVLHLQVLDLSQRLRIRGIHLLFGHQFLFVIIECQRQLFRRGTYAFITLNPALDAFYLPHLCLGGFGIIPESRSLRVQLFLLQLNAFLVNLQVRLQLIRPLLYILQLFYRYHKPIICQFKIGCKGTKKNPFMQIYLQQNASAPWLWDVQTLFRLHGASTVLRLCHTNDRR